MYPKSEMYPVLGAVAPKISQPLLLETHTIQLFMTRILLMSEEDAFAAPKSMSKIDF